MRRRLGKLETVFVVDSPLTADEIEPSGWRRHRHGPSPGEARVVGQCLIKQGELLITAHQGRFFVNRYPGIDLACV